MKRIFVLTAGIMMILSAGMTGQQVPDTSYNPVIKNPAYAAGKGPVIFIDEGHNNFHTKNNRYLPFARLLERDGYRTEAYTGAFEADKLENARILVISNALSETNATRWYKPVLPAFTPEETGAVRQWVNNGGSLFLIADHMPMGGGAAPLAEVFGFGFTDGFATETFRPGAITFKRATGSLSDNIITDGRNPSEKVNTIVSFTGQAFTIPDDATSILSFDDSYTMLLPDTAWVFNQDTPTINIGGWSQAAFKKYGKGRVVVAGEAAMFTAQLAGPQKFPVGLNSPEAKENYQLLLNIIHWLDRLME